MPIAGKIIIINGANEQLTKEIVLALRDDEKQNAYFHIGYSVLKEHFAPKKCSNLMKLLPALFAAISASART